jgi:histidinol-phosphate aminotransferase
MERPFAPRPRKILERLQPYVPGKAPEEVRRSHGLEKVIKMASNENPWGTSPKALERAKMELEKSALYPEGSCLELREALAKRYEVSKDMIVVSNGGDNVLGLIAHAFLEVGDEAVMATPTFPIYRTAALVAGGEPIEVPLRNFVHDLHAMAQKVGPRTKLLFICNPNNPTGTIVRRHDLMGFLETLPETVLVVLDEVYCDFVEEEDFPDGISLIKEGWRILSVRSFSKLYGLAGLRIGYAVGPEDIIDALEKVREPFPVNRVAQAAALGALEDEEFRRFVISETKGERKRLASALEDMGLNCLESHTNFLFVDLGRDSEVVFEKLLRMGIIIRPGKIWGTPTWCRITIGRREENQELLSALRKVLAG